MGEQEQAPALSEDRVRAGCYGLISRLFYAPPDAGLLSSLAAAAPIASADSVEEPTGQYAAAVAALSLASRNAEAEAVRDEFDHLFISAGKALITPYTSGYIVPNAPDRHLVALRAQLAEWGLGRRESVFEMEDHIAAICDVMRWLIERDRPLEAQQAFFESFVYSGVGPFCNAIESCASASFYVAVARFARAFVELEKEAFALE